MFKENNSQLTIGEHLIYQNLPEDVLSRINKLIDWHPFEKILASLHPAKVGRKAYNPVMMLKILVIQQIYGHSDPEFVCTPANVHDSQVIDELLEGNEAAIFADKAYDEQAFRKRCREEGKFCGILAKARRGRPLSAKQKRRNQVLSRIRAKIERVFGIFSLHLQRERARYVGLFANEIHLFLTCFTYNILNLYWRLRRREAF